MVWGAPVAGVEDAFGVRARRLRALEAKMRSVAEAAGCEEVIPPLVERPEALRTGAGRFLAEQTIVFSDPEGGGALAIRPDITPQVARLVATRFVDASKLRLFYSAPVLFAHPDTPGGRREAWQFGVELFGLDAGQGDRQALRLAARMLAAGDLPSPTLLIGHVALLQSLVDASAVPLEDWAQVIARRSPDDVAALAKESGLDAVASLLAELCDADEAWLVRQAEDARMPAAFVRAARQLLALREALNDAEVEVRIEPALVPRFWYHSGLVFEGFARNGAQALLRGGRYDALMQARGCTLSAIGFSLDLWDWVDAKAGSEQ